MDVSGLQEGKGWCRGSSRLWPGHAEHTPSVTQDSGAMWRWPAKAGAQIFPAWGYHREGVAGTTGSPGITSSGQPQGTKGDRTPGLPPGSALPHSLCDLSDSLTLSQPTFLNRQVGPRSEGQASATIIMPSSQMSKLRLRQVKCCLQSAAGGLQNWTDPLNSHECWCHRQGPL